MSSLKSDQRKPAFDQSLHSNYCSAIYLCQNFRLKHNGKHPDFAAFMRQEGYRNFAFLTAFNPYSAEISSLRSNHRRNRKLEDKLLKLRLPFLQAQATDETGVWPPEAGFFIFNGTLREYLALGEAFGQHAILFASCGTTPEVLWCHGRL